MRGEYISLFVDPHVFTELPPRARRIQSAQHIGHEQWGTTSACAENTVYRRGIFRTPRNYLRVRGEYHHHVDMPYSIMELPPRARRILPEPVESPLRVGTTSACAENTGQDTGGNGFPGNYLRVRGEYIRCPLYTCPTPELPPRARRIHSPPVTRLSSGGTTSACAENTPWSE